MKCKSKISDEIYNYEHKDKNVVHIWNDNGFKILISKPMFEKCYIIMEEDE